MIKKNETEEYSFNMQDDANTTSIKLLEQSFDYMKVALNEIKQSIGELRREVQNNFVSKDEFKNLKLQVESIENLKNLTIKIIVSAVIVSLLSLVMIK